MFDFSNYSAKYLSIQINIQNIMMIQVFAGKMKDDMAGFAVEKSEMYSFLIDDSSDHKKVTGFNKNITEKIRHSEYKDTLLNSKCLEVLDQ